ncbi:MAG: LTA synthase family protein [Paenibacillaceae bacterium]|nr:LTA synthase family protein [Paenibacillaceae bacterium]
MTRTGPFVFFTILLFAKSCLAWLVVFGDVSWMPLATELPFIWLVFCLIELFAARRKLLYYVLANLLLTLLFFSVIMYYKYYGVIATYHALQQVNQVTAVSNSVFSLMDPQYLFLFLDVIVLLALLLRKGRTGAAWRYVSLKRERRGFVATLLIVSFALCLINVLPNRASMSERKQAAEMGILSYEAYSLFARSEPEPVAPQDITQAGVNELKGIRAPEQPLLAGAAAGKNILVIQLESFQNFLIGLKIDGREVTPNMNRLAAEHFYFPRFYQQVGQGNTSDAEFVVNTSLYIPPKGAATMSYVDKALPSLPKLLRAEGYRTATFHTNVVEFWNRGELYEALGFERYYDKPFFGTEDEVFFGASDEVLYAKTAAELAAFRAGGERFYAQVVSMTAHHPFTIPQEKRRLQLPERYEGTFVGDYIRAQHYADEALGAFIDELKRSGVWDDSLVVLYGDHLGLPVYSLDRDDKELLAEIYGHKYGYPEMINVPLLIASPGVTYPARFEQVGGQVDLLPTIANLAGVPLDGQLHFGHDLLNQTTNVLPQRYYLPSGSLLDEDTLFIPGSGYEDGEYYPLTGGGDGSGGISQRQYEAALRLLQLADNYVLQLPDRES